MNFEEVLNYRNRCIICQRKLEMKALDLAGITMYRTVDGLMVETGLKGVAVHFKSDNKYEKMKRWNNLYVKPFSILKECPTCLPDIMVDGKALTLKSRSLGATTLMQLKDLRCAYTISFFGDSEDNFDSKLEWEDIKFNDGDRFYHIKTNFTDNTTNILSGGFKTDSIDSMIRMTLPAVNATSISNTEQLINKLKLYNLFS